ncbi:hypothetical protein RTM1035_11175 [Roseovarius sp. TM1035]|nr:hypothetical protein RTM1035_11175 [Roseovarius sp. TM1035]
MPLRHLSQRHTIAMAFFDYPDHLLPRDKGFMRNANLTLALLLARDQNSNIEINIT